MNTPFGAWLPPSMVIPSLALDLILPPIQRIPEPPEMWIPAPLAPAAQQSRQVKSALAIAGNWPLIGTQRGELREVDHRMLDYLVFVDNYTAERCRFVIEDNFHARALT